MTLATLVPGIAARTALIAIMLALPGPLRAQSPAAAQTPAAAAVLRPAAGGEEVDPLTCWWRTSVSAITVGQPFTLVLTCAVIDGDTVAAVVDRARLDPKAIELAPFDVLGGTVAAEVKAGDRTFFQFEYQLRFVNDAFFGQDVALPNLSIAYRIQTRGANQQAATQGMERRFAMPQHSLRVTSLVPGDAADIRDTTAMTFADVDALAARGRLLSTSGLVVMLLAAVCVVAGVGRAAGTRRVKAPVASGRLSESTILRSARRALTAVRQRVDAAGTWTHDDVERALGAARVVSECAVGASVSQHLAATREVVPSGALGVKGRFGTGPLVVVSASSTAKTLSGLATETPRDSARVAALAEVLATFTAAQYAEATPLDDAALTAALATVTGLAGRLSMERLPVLQRLTPWITRRPMERRVS